MNDWMQFRPWWDRHVIGLMHTSTCNIKKTHVLCCVPKTLNGVLIHLFLVYSFSTLWITLFISALIKYSIHLYSTSYYFCSFIKPCSVVQVPVTRFALSIFESSNSNHHIVMDKYFLFANLFYGKKYAFIVYILSVFV